VAANLILLGHLPNGMNNYFEFKLVILSGKKQLAVCSWQWNHFANCHLPTANWPKWATWILRKR
jgi:hypothetical protein